MAYGLKYYVQTYDRRGSLVEADILQNGYAGSSQLIDGGIPPVIIQWDSLNDTKHDTVKGSTCTLQLNCNNSMFFFDLYTSDPLQYMVVVKVAGVVNWIGYILPEQYAETYAASEVGYFVSIIATDRLGTLKDIDYLNSGAKYTGRVILMDIVRNILGKIALENYSTSYGGYIIGLNLLETNNTDNNATNALVQNYEYNEKYINDDGTVWKCSDVLNNILKQFGCRIVQYKGMWNIYRMNELTASIRRQFYHYEGTYQTNDLFSSLLAITPNATADNARLIWMGDANLLMLPPWKSFNLVQHYLAKADVLNDGKFAKWLASDYSVWTTSGTQNFANSWVLDEGSYMLACQSQNVGAWQGYMINSAYNVYVDHTMNKNLIVEMVFSSRVWAGKFGFEISLGGAWWLVADGTWQNTQNIISYTNASTDNFVTKKVESLHIPVGTNMILSVKIYNPQVNAGGVFWFKHILIDFVNAGDHSILADKTSLVSINTNYNQLGDDYDVTGGDGLNNENVNTESYGPLAYGPESSHNVDTYTWGPRGGAKNDRLLNFIKNDIINLYKLPSKKLSGKLESSILTPLNTILEPWCDNAIFMMHRLGWSVADNEFDAEYIELFTSSFFLLEDGSGYYLMEDNVSHYNY
jgi:hypothetical protein